MPTPRSFIVIAIILLLWNLSGIAAFVMQYTADLTALAKTDPTTARAFAAMPGWAWVVYAMGVGAGTLGVIALLLRKSVAASLFLFSLIAVLIQFGHIFLGTDLLAAKGWGAAVFPAIIIAIGVIQLLIARAMVARGVLQ